MYSSAVPTIFNNAFELDKKALAMLNCVVSKYVLKMLNPTLSTTVNDVYNVPYEPNKIPEIVLIIVAQNIFLHNMKCEFFVQLSFHINVLNTINEPCTRN